MSNKLVKECATCMYWRHLEFATLGQCGRHPPLVLRLSEDRSVTLFPETPDECWCGEWTEGRNLLTPNEQAIAGKQAN